MDFRTRLGTLLFLLVVAPLGLTFHPVSAEVKELSETELEDTINKHLFVFVLFYQPPEPWGTLGNALCLGKTQPGISEFEQGASIAKANGMSKYLDLIFVKVAYGSLANEKYKIGTGIMSCSSKPGIGFFKYGHFVEYGLSSRYGHRIELDDYKLTTKAMFDFLEQKTKSSVTIIQTAAELKGFESAKESVIVGYYKEDSRARLPFWNLAERRKDYTWGSVTNQSLNQFSQDTIVAMKNYGVGRAVLDKNLTAENIEAFIELNAQPTGPVLELTDKNFQDVIQKKLLVFVLFYDPTCLTPEFFDNAAHAADINGMARFLDMKFAKVNVKKGNVTQKMYNVSVVSDCKYMYKNMMLFRYGEPRKYSEYIRSQKTETVEGLFEWLQDYTKPAASIIESETDLMRVVNVKEFTTIGYFKEDTKAKMAYWKLANQRKDFVFGAVTNQSINPFTVDTIVVNQPFGATFVTLNMNLSFETLDDFVQLNAEPFSIWNISEKYLQSVIDRKLLVFVVFYDKACSVPEYFVNVTHTAERNGMTVYLNMKFGKVDINQPSIKRKYGVSSSSDCKDMWKNMILFRYGKPIRYGSDKKVETDQLETSEGMLKWLEMATKPAAKIIDSENEFRLFIEFTKVTVLGYFNMASKGKLEFWNAADNLTDYRWAAVTNPYMNPFEVDTIIITQEFGVSRMMFNENLTQKNIERLVKLNAISTFPVPTRPVPADRNETWDAFHRSNNILYVYDGAYFSGNSDRLNLTDGCVDLTSSWDQEIKSIRTFGQCVKIYDSFQCKREVPDGVLALNNENIAVHEDLRIAGFHTKVRSVGTCYEKVASAAKSNAGDHWGAVAFAAITVWMLKNPYI